MKINIKNIVLLLITFIFLYLVFVNIDFLKLIKLVKEFDFRYIFILVISISCSLSLRAFCYKQLIYKTVKKPEMKELIALCHTGAALNILLPARAGDIFRAYYTGKKYNADKIKIFGSVMLERIFDVFVIFSFLCFGIFTYHRNQLAINLCLFAAIVLFFGIIFTFVTYKYNRVDKVCSYIVNKTFNSPFNTFINKTTNFVKNLCNSFFDGFEIIDSPKRILYALFFAMGIWFFECMNFLIVIYGFGYDIHWSVSIFIISFIALACMIPSTSIFIGPYQLAVISAFAIYDISKETALAISILEQTVVTIFVSIVAFLFLCSRNISFKDLKKDINEEII